MADVGGAAALVADHRDLVAGSPEVEHRPHEVPARPAEEPRGADDPGVAACGSLAVELRPAVHRLRVGRVRLEIRLALAAVEHVVGREVDERRPELDRVLRAADVDRRGLLRIALGPVDVRPRGCVEDEVDRAERPRRERDVPVGAGKAERTREGLAERGSELAARAGYDDASRAESVGDEVLQRWRTRSSSQGMPCSSGFAASYSSVTR